MITCPLKPLFTAILCLVSLHFFAQSIETRTYKPLYTPPLPSSNGPTAVSQTFEVAAASVAGPTASPQVGLSPEISQLNTLRDLPVNKFTGAPIISIPITELKEGNLSVPIALSYQSTGIKINQVASWVGLGWDLVGVPLLTRVVRDLPDEGKWDDTSPRTGYYANSVMASNPSSNYTNDTEPDYFLFNYQGQSVKFMFDYNGQAHFDPAIDAQVKVSLRSSYNSNAVYRFDKITITLPDGTAYYFSDSYTESSVEVLVEDVYTYNLYPGQSDYETFAKSNKTVSAWFCYKITHPLGHEIQIQYDKQGYSYYKLADQLGSGYLPTYNANKLSRVYIYSCSVASIEGSLSKIVFNNGINQSSSYRDPETGQNVITNFPNTSYARRDMDGFVQSPQNISDGKILKSTTLIDKKNSNGQLIWSFSHDYFLSSSDDLPNNYSLAGFNAVGESHKKRLRLNSVQFPDFSTFKFTYHNPNNLPSRFTFASDHWGYYNGIFGNEAYGQVGIDYDNPNGSGSTKRADELYTQFGILKSISSTSGIHSVYEFEGNRCSNYNAGNEALGGLRIKSISSVDSIRNITQTKKYTYLNEDGSPSGFLFVKPKYRFQNQSGTYYHFSGLYSYLLSESNRPILGYDRVVEESYTNADLGLSTGKVVTLFNQYKSEFNLDFDNLGTTRYYLHKYHPSSDPSLGSIKKETAYAQNGNIVSETSYFYNYPQAELYLYSIKKNRFMGVSTSSTSEAYYNSINKFRLKSTQQKTYGLGGGGQAQTQSVSITYKDEMPVDYQTKYPGKHNLPVKTTTTHADGSISESWNKYVGDFTLDIDTITTIDESLFNQCVSDDPDNYHYCLNYAKTVTISRNVPAPSSDIYGIYTMIDTLKALPVESISSFNNLVYQANYLRYTGKAQMQQWFELRKFPLSTFRHVEFDTSDNTLKDSHYGAAQGSIESFNAKGLPLRIAVTYGAKKSFTYDATGFVPLSQTQNAGKTDALTTSYEYQTPLFGPSKEISPNLLEKRYTYINSTGQLDYLQDQENRILLKKEYALSNGRNLVPNKITQYVARQATTNASQFVQPGNSLSEISYLDGGLQPIQSVLKQQSPSQNDILKGHVEVDALGRAKKSYLPLPLNQNTGNFVSNPLPLSQSFYNDQVPYTEQESFEASPRSSPIKTLGVGQAFRRAGGNLGQNFNFQIESGTFTKRSISYVNGNLQVTNSTYAAGEVRSETTQDEAGNQSKVFYNAQNQVLERWQIAASGETLKSAFVYDALGRLVYSIPPALYAAANQNFNESASFFAEGIAAIRYDSLGRAFQTKSPGAAWVYKVYNKLGQVVLEQNGLLREKNLWAWMKYDGHGRLVMKGVFTPSGSATQAIFQMAFDDFTNEAQFEEPGQQLFGYTNKSFPPAVSIAEANVMAVYYYDSYNWLAGNLGFVSYASSTPYSNANGLLCGSMVRRLDTQAFLRTVHYYDAQGRMIQTLTENRFGGINQSDWRYTFGGDLLEEHQIYRKPASDPLEKSVFYTYDMAGRKTRAELRVNAQSFPLANYSYDALGRLQSKTLNPIAESIVRSTGLLTSTTDVASSVIQLKPGFYFDARQGNKSYSASIRTRPFQQLDYAYHIRGGLRGINLDANGNIALQNGDVFGLKLDHFESGQYFDGKLQKQTWVGSDGQPRSYSYQYDAFNRLSNAVYGGQGAENYSVSQSYDANGNILSLTRNGKVGSQYTTIDQLNYTYPSSSNKLQAASDQALSNVGFIDQTATQEYTYWSDGSLKSDINKGIQQIEYNYLGLPERVSFSNGKYIEWGYDAEGLKLYQRFVSGGTTSTLHYMGDLLYRNDTLVSIFHDEGYLQVQGNAYKLRFHVSDHLGNTRMVLESRAGALAMVQETHYGPWGEVLEGLGLSADWAFLYQGKEWMNAGGLNWYDFEARAYDPFRAQFTSQDPVLNPMLSGYAAMNNNPASYIDPDGRSPFLAAVAIGAGIAALSNATSQAIRNKGFRNFSWGSFGASVGVGAILGGVGFGIGSLFGGAASGGGFNLVEEITRASFHGFASSLASEFTTGNFESGFISGSFGSFTGSLTNGIDDPILQIGASATAGGLGSRISGGDFWEGFAVGGIVSGTNHGLHNLNRKKFFNKDKSKWDLNGDGKLQKYEADYWWLHGNGAGVSVNNENINWSGLKIPDGTQTGSIFGLSTTDAFLKLPFETAATYGGTSFKVIDASQVMVLDQLYHYQYRPNNSTQNVIRNFMNWLGKPIAYGTDFKIHYINPTIRIK